MPHVVVKATAVGSAGDLFKITEALEGIPVNILSIGGGEGVTATGEIGVIAMLIDKDDDATIATVKTTLQNLQLGNGRTLEDVETFPNVHIELPDKPGELKKALDAVTGLNVRSVLSMGTVLGNAHVGLGFAASDQHPAEDKLKAKGITVHPHPH
jgi:hypothetical protein